VFRLRRQQALINRMGFNSDGLEVVRARLDALGPRRGALGANIGANQDSTDPVADYVTCLRSLYPLVDYVAVNVSSPNTPGLRDLQSEAFLRPLLAAAREIGERPVLVKIDPDLGEAAAVELAAMAVDAGAAGIVATNTTVDHALLPGCQAEGGLSGHVLREKSFRILAALARELFGRTLLVSVGGVDSAAEAYRRLRAGASLLQLYTPLVFHGPGLVGDVHRGLLARLERDGFVRLADAVGADLRPEKTG
jgi:dihydroorotate dehydrogenase